MRISDWSSDVCSSDLLIDLLDRLVEQLGAEADRAQPDRDDAGQNAGPEDGHQHQGPDQRIDRTRGNNDEERDGSHEGDAGRGVARRAASSRHRPDRSEEHTPALPTQMRDSYAD